MKKSSPPYFRFPPPYFLDRRNDYPKSFSTNRPKYVRTLVIWNTDSSLNKPIPRNFKHLKYVSFLKSNFYKPLKDKIERTLLHSIKTIKHVQVSSTYNYSIRTLFLANKYFSNLKSYSLRYSQAKVLQSLKTLRRTETLRISSLNLGEIFKEGRNLKRIAVKKIVLEESKTNSLEMMKIAKLVPKSTRLHFELEELLQEADANEIKTKLTEKIGGIRLKQLSNNSLNSIAQIAEYWKNLTHLSLGKLDRRSGICKLNHDTNSRFFSKLGELTKLRSLKMDLNLTQFYISERPIELIKLLTLPIGLETLSLGLEGIVMKGKSALTRDDLSKVFDQIGRMKELKTLKLDFYMHYFCQELWEDFVSLFPKGLQKLEALSTEFGIWKSKGLIKIENVFGWVHSHPMLRSVRLDLSLLDSFELESKKIFDYKIRFLESFYVNIAHRKTEMREPFENLVEFLANHEGLKRLTLRVFKSDDFPKTLQILNKYLGAVKNLEDLRLEFVISDGTVLENFACLKPLMKKIKTFSLSVENRLTYYKNYQYCQAFKKLFADEIEIKRKGLNISFNEISI